MNTDREKLINWIRYTYVSNSSCAYKATVDDTADAVIADMLIANGVVVREWIPVMERLPEEHDSIFARLHGTKSWMPGMFRTVSDTVLTSIEREDGTRTVKAMHTQGGEWNLDSMPWAKKVTHWMPLPEPPKEGD